MCGSRILVADAIYEKFRDKFVAAVGAMTVGDPSCCQMGSLISQQHRAKVESYIKLAKEEGGTVLTGGCRPSPELPGAFLRPTVIEGLDILSRTATEEIFGPMVRESIVLLSLIHARALSCFPSCVYRASSLAADAGAGAGAVVRCTRVHISTRTYAHLLARTGDSASLCYRRRSDCDGQRDKVRSCRVRVDVG